MLTFKLFFNRFWQAQRAVNPVDQPAKRARSDLRSKFDRRQPEGVSAPKTSNCKSLTCTSTPVLRFASEGLSLAAPRPLCGGCAPPLTRWPYGLGRPSLCGSPPNPKPAEPKPSNSENRNPNLGAASGRTRRPSAGYALPFGHPYRGGGYRRTLPMAGLRAPARRERQSKPLALSGPGDCLDSGFASASKKRLAGSRSVRGCARFIEASA